MADLYIMQMECVMASDHCRSIANTSWRLDDAPTQSMKLYLCAFGKNGHKILVSTNILIYVGQLKKIKMFSIL